MTEEKTTYITHETLNQAWNNWLHFHRGIHCEETELRFYTYCHSLEQSFVDDALNWDDDDLWTHHVAASTAYRVNLLAGPNFNMIIRAYYVNHPWK